MILVKTVVKPSPGRGLGLFADEFIPKGTIWWKWDESFDRIFTEEQVQMMPEVIQDFMYNFGFEFKPGYRYICMDNSRYTNHADEGNSYSDDLGNSIAKIDIQPGDEILENYSNFDINPEFGFDIV